MGRTVDRRRRRVDVSVVAVAGGRPQACVASRGAGRARRARCALRPRLWRRSDVGASATREAVGRGRAVRRGTSSSARRSRTRDGRRRAALDERRGRGSRLRDDMRGARARPGRGEEGDRWAGEPASRRAAGESGRSSKSCATRARAQRESRSLDRPAVASRVTSSGSGDLGRSRPDRAVRDGRLLSAGSSRARSPAWCWSQTVRRPGCTFVCPIC